MKVIFYERVGHEGRRPSPFSWRIRYALAHKGLEPEVIPVRFADAERVIALSGQRFVPVLVHGERVVPDSWGIACYLDDTFPDRPPLFAGEPGRALSRFVSRWVDEALHPIIRGLVLPEFLDCLDAGDRAYYRTSREATLGQTLEAFAGQRGIYSARLAEALAPLRLALGERQYLCGDSPQFADYMVFGALQWARLGSPHDILEGEPVVARYRERMRELHDALGDRFPGYPRPA